MDDVVVDRPQHVPLTEQDRAELQQRFSDAVEDLTQLETHKKAVVADVNGDIKRTQVTVQELNAILRAGYRVRQVACRVLFHEPVPNYKRFVSLENAEQVGGDELMSAEEVQRNAQRTFGDPNDERKPRSRRQ